MVHYKIGEREMNSIISNEVVKVKNPDIEFTGNKSKQNKFEANGISKKDMMNVCHECIQNDIISPVAKSVIRVDDRFFKDEESLDKFGEKGPKGQRFYHPVCKMHYDMMSGTQIKQKKVNRNDPCVCGSGKKLKRCCINKKL